MNNEQARKLAAQALDALAQALEQGKSEAMTAYLAAMARFHRYSFGNVLLIALQMPEASRVAGYRTWLEMKRYVKKGEQGIVIFAPIRLRKHKHNDGGDGNSGDGETPEESQSDPDETVETFKSVYVFDISQTDGEPLPEFAGVRGDPDAYLTRLRMHVEEAGIELAYSENLRGASGASTGGRISLRPGLPPAEEFATLVHELAHERLHHGPERQELSQTVVELEAEAAAFVVCQTVGLDTGTASSDYIQLYRGDKALLAASLETIQTTAADILSAIGVDG